MPSRTWATAAQLPQRRPPGATPASAARVGDRAAVAAAQLAGADLALILERDVLEDQLRTAADGAAQERGEVALHARTLMRRASIVAALRASLERPWPCT